MKPILSQCHLHESWAFVIPVLCVDHICCNWLSKTIFLSKLFLKLRKYQIINIKFNNSGHISNNGTIDVKSRRAISESEVKIVHLVGDPHTKLWFTAPLTSLEVDPKNTLCFVKSKHRARSIYCHDELSTCPVVYRRERELREEEFRPRQLRRQRRWAWSWTEEHTRQTRRRRRP